MVVRSRALGTGWMLPLRNVSQLATLGWPVTGSELITDEGAVFSFGGGHDGKLGHGDEMPQYFPAQIKALCGYRCERHIKKLASMSYLHPRILRR